MNEYAKIERELKEDGFTKEEIDHIILMLIWGHSIDSAIQSLFI